MNAELSSPAASTAAGGDSAIGRPAGASAVRGTKSPVSRRMRTRSPSDPWKTSISARSNSAAMRASTRTDSNSPSSPVGLPELTTLSDAGAALVLASRFFMILASQVRTQRRGGDAHQVAGLAQAPTRQDGARKKVLGRQHPDHERQRFGAQRELL